MPWKSPRPRRPWPERPGERRGAARRAGPCGPTCTYCRMMSLTPILLAVGGSAVALAASGTQPLTPAAFERKPGWHVGAGRVHACPGVPRSRCTQVGSWAATVPWRDCQDCATAPRTLRSLPPSGIVIYLLLGSEARLPRHRLRWPPLLRAADITGPVEGTPGRIGYFGRGGRLHGFTAQLFVYFGRRHPTQRQLARARAELRTARLP